MTAAEAAANKKAGQLPADLAAGVDAISSNQVVRFTRYLRVVLPLDGFVFWVKADLLSPSAIFNAMGGFNNAGLNQPRLVTKKAGHLDAKGSLHYATDTRQEEAETYGLNRVVFTSEVEVQDLNEVAPNELYLGTFQGIRFAFTARQSFYKQADLYHYVGNAVYPDMETQIVDDVGSLRAADLVVSNSLPIWLSMANTAPVDYLPFSNPFPMYPSFLAPNNIVPPWITVHVPPESTKALGSTPVLGRRLTHSQLTEDTVRITLWGLRNDEAMNFVDFVNQFSYYTDLIGIMNTPVPRDEKRTQSETNTLAIKKTIEYQVSYQQLSVRDVARQLILRVIPTFIFPP